MNLTYLFKTVRVATPMVLAEMVYTVSGFLGMLMLAHLGHNVLAASGLLYATETMIKVIGISPLFSLSAMVAQAYGKNERYEIGNLIQQAWCLAGVIAVIMMLLYLFIQPLLLILGQSPHLIKLIVSYFYITLWALPAFTINMVNIQFCLGIGKQKLSMFVTICQVVIVVCLGYVLIDGKLGFSALGITGWAIANVISIWIEFFLFAVFFFATDEFKQYYLFKTHVNNQWRHLRKLLNIGYPLILQTAGELLSFSFIIFMTGWLGQVPLAAMEVVVQFLMWMIIPAYGISIAAAVLVGQSLGAKKYADARHYGNSSLLLGLILLSMFGVILNVFPRSLAQWFLSLDQPHYTELLSIIRILFILIVFSQFFDTVRNVLTGALRGMFDTKIPMLAGLVSIWLVRMPLAYFFGLMLKQGIYGIVYSAIIGTAVGGLWLWWRWQKKSRNL